MSKTIKLLSDGTIAKVGMIVVITNYYGGNQKDTITRIQKVTYPNEEFVLVDSRPPFAYVDHFAQPIDTLRKAIAEERKQYYQQLYLNQNG